MRVSSSEHHYVHPHMSFDNLEEAKRPFLSLESPNFPFTNIVFSISISLFLTVPTPVLDLTLENMTLGSKQIVNRFQSIQRYWPSPEKNSYPITASKWSSNVCNGAPVPKFQSLTFLSLDVDAISLLFGENTTSLIELVWSLSIYLQGCCKPSFITWSCCQ